MTVVRIIKNWDWPDLMRQTPGCRGVWDGIQFTLDPVEACDYTIVLNNVPQETTVQCPPRNVWSVMQEPPNERFRLDHRGISAVKRVYTQNPELRSKRYIHSHPAIPWHVNKDYDYLSSCSMPDKIRNVSWITSNKSIFRGHRKRLRFLEAISRRNEFDLFGRGFSPIEDKWDGLAPYRYSIAVENFRNPHYWSEKLADCFLAWTMPIYYGCTRISEYFPADAMIQIDIDDPEAAEKISEAISRNLWRRNLDAIDHARRLVLDQYQLFPFIAQQIRANEQSNNFQIQTRRSITMSSQIKPPNLLERDRWRLVSKRMFRAVRGSKRMLRRLRVG